MSYRAIVNSTHASHGALMEVIPCVGPVREGRKYRSTRVLSFALIYLSGTKVKETTQRSLPIL